MAKDNLFLGFARGKIGDVVFSRVNGQQVSRARNRSPKNPQSLPQMLQRVIVSTVGKMYSFTQELSDHSFEGFDGASLNQQQFMKENIAAMRDALANIIAYPTWDEIETADGSHQCYSVADSYFPVLNTFIISEGTLPTINLYYDETATLQDTVLRQIPLSGVSTVPQSPLTYQQVCDALGIDKGDQLTFIWFNAPNGALDYQLKEMSVARVIMEPASGNMTEPFYVAGTGAVNDPNERNTGNVTFSVTLPQDSSRCVLNFFLDIATGYSNKACAVIRSKWSNGKWLRSTQKICRVKAGEDWMGEPSLAEAILSLIPSTSGSELYLNQATI